MKENKTSKKTADYSRELDGTPRAAVQMGGRTIWICHVPKHKRLQLRHDIVRVMEEADGNDAVATLKIIDLLTEVFGWKIEETHTSGKQKYVDPATEEVIEEPKITELSIACRGYKAAVQRVVLADGSIEIHIDNATKAYIKQALEDVANWTEEDHAKAEESARKFQAWKDAMSRKRKWEQENVHSFSMAAAFAAFKPKE